MTAALMATPHLASFPGAEERGYPTPTISWMDNNGTTVSDGTGISGSTTLSLAITGVTHYQAGNWTCTVENYLASNKAEALMFNYRLPQDRLKPSYNIDLKYSVAQ